ncbi:MAG: DUF423 domain-containing protein [Myxococcota bacterium]|nr:DUF423 domain-containing protein [Myxococcota bacterium]
MNARTLRIGAILMALAVAAGAFGAHGLEDMVTPERLQTWNTGARYMVMHSLALCGIALLPRTPRAVGALFLAGILLFSGSLFALVLLDMGVLGAITPLGGLAFISGWIALAVQAPKLIETRQ